MSESDANTNGDEPSTASWSAATVAGQTVLGQDGQSQWTGLLAPLGPVVDMINAQTCSGSSTGLPTGGSALVCLLVLYGDANALAPNSTGAILQGAVLLNEGNDTPLNGVYQFDVLRSFAQSGGCFNPASADIARLYVNNGLTTQLVPVGYVEDVQECQ